MNELRPVWDNDIERLGLEIKGISSLLLAFGEQFEPHASRLSDDEKANAINCVIQHHCRIGSDLTNIAMNKHSA